jgi:tRNA (cmo5U34)-methyltransferase
MNNDRIKNHFESEAREFDDLILKLIPHYGIMVQTLVEAIPFEKSSPLRVIDLGCGTGTVAAKVLESFPNAQVICLDLAENMVAMAQEKLGHNPRASFVVADLSAYHFNAMYDVAVSSLALHHLATDKDKQQFYRRIYESLHSGGVFYNADVVLASNDHLQSIYMKEWRSFMGRSVSRDEIEGKWMPTYQEEDRPAKLLDQLEWLKAIGFRDVDVIWKYFNFTVYGGVRK